MGNYWSEVYEYRNTLKSLVLKNIIGRYKNSFLGFLWHFITPIVMMIVYYIVFTQIRVNPIPEFWLYIASALFPLTFMVSNLTTGCGSIVSNSSMIKKMYFPREIIVYSNIISSFIIMIFGYSIVITATVLSGHPVDCVWLLLPLFMVIMALFTTGYTLVLSALTVYVKDIQHLISSISMVFFFITPIYFLPDSTSGMFKLIVEVNPFTSYIELFHSVIYYNQIPIVENLVACVLLSLVMIIIGHIVFRRLKQGFVERL